MVEPFIFSGKVKEIRIFEAAIGSATRRDTESPLKGLRLSVQGFEYPNGQEDAKIVLNSGRTELSEDIQDQFVQYVERKYDIECVM